MLFHGNRRKQKHCLKFSGRTFGIFSVDISSVKRDGLISFLVHSLSVFFFCFIAPPSVLRTILKRSGNSGSLSAVPNFSEIALSFSPFRTMVSVGSLYCVEIYSCQGFAYAKHTFSRTFIMKMLVLDFVKCLFCLY